MFHDPLTLNTRKPWIGAAISWDDNATTPLDPEVVSLMRHRS
jgi:hypothetical protein